MKKELVIIFILSVLMIYSVSAVENNFKFTGKPLDSESGLYYYGSRYYNPDVGRFITPDSLVGSLANPLSLNRYTYVSNNPLKYVDPSGSLENPADATNVAIVVAPKPTIPQPPTMSQGRSYVAPDGPTMGQAYPRQDEVALGINGAFIGPNGDVIGNPFMEGVLVGAALDYGGGKIVKGVMKVFLKRASGLERSINAAIDSRYSFTSSASGTMRTSGEAVGGFNKARGHVADLIASGKQHLDLEDLRNIHGMVTEGQGANFGIRGLDNAANVGTSSGLFKYPDANKVPALMEQWLEWNTAAAKSGMNQFVRASKSRELFTKIHPFSDANGRTGDLIESFYGMQSQ